MKRHNTNRETVKVVDRLVKGPEENKTPVVPNAVTAPVATVQMIQQQVQKLGIKYNAKSLMEQETTETLDKFINIVMGTVMDQEKQIKELNEKLSKYEKPEKKV